jgi:hypothetical protein
MRRTELKFQPYVRNLETESPPPDNLLPRALSEDFATVPFFNLHYAGNGTPAVGSFFLFLPKILEAGDAGAFEKFSCVSGVERRKGIFQSDGAKISNDELAEKLEALFEVSRHLSRVECHELRINDGRCFSIHLQWGWRHHSFKNIIQKYGRPPIKAASQLRNSTSTSFEEKVRQRIQDKSPRSIDLKIPFERLLRSAELGRDDLDLLRGSFPVDRVIYAQKLGDGKDDLDLFSRLCKRTSETKLKSIKEAIQDASGEPLFDENSTWEYATSSRRYPVVKGIFKVGGSIFETEEGVYKIFGRDGIWSCERTQSSRLSGSSALAEVIMELVMNAYIHGHADSGEDSNRDDTRSWWYANAIAIGHFTNRLEVSNLKIDDIILKTKVPSIFGIMPHRSPRHIFLKDIGLAHGRSLGHYIVRHRLKECGLPAPLYLDGGSTFRAIIPKDDHFGHF